MSLRKIIFLTFNALIGFCAFSQTPAQLAQQQLDAYNNRDIEAFLAPYSDSVKIYNHPNELLFSGKEAMRKRYATKFENTPDLHCTLMNRMVLGNTVIDQEYVINDKNAPPTEVIAIYKIEAEKIVEVYFIRPKL
uniref:nuclear transport factor 2 family protein n=1 Tax=Roseivirga sp. TaxID=1964215 RepID=UPI004047E698